MIGEVITTNLGRIRGFEQDGCSVYLSIPFAKPPVGEYAFKHGCIKSNTAKLICASTPGNKKASPLKKVTFSVLLLTIGMAATTRCQTDLHEETEYPFASMYLVLLPSPILISAPFCTIRFSILAADAELVPVICSTSRRVIISFVERYARTASSAV